MLLFQGEVGEHGQKGAKGAKGEHVSNFNKTFIFSVSGNDQSDMFQRNLVSLCFIFLCCCLLGSSWSTGLNGSSRSAWSCCEFKV